MNRRTGKNPSGAIGDVNGEIDETDKTRNYRSQSKRR